MAKSGSEMTVQIRDVELQGKFLEGLINNASSETKQYVADSLLMAATRNGELLTQCVAMCGRELVEAASPNIAAKFQERVNKEIDDETGETLKALVKSSIAKELKENRLAQSISVQITNTFQEELQLQVKLAVSQLLPTVDLQSVATDFLSHQGEHTILEAVKLVIAQNFTNTIESSLKTQMDEALRQLNESVARKVEQVRTTDMNLMLAEAFDRLVASVNFGGMTAEQAVTHRIASVSRKSA